VAALGVHHDRQALERKAAGARWRESGMVFTTSIGTSIDPDRLNKEYKALLGAPACGTNDSMICDTRRPR
jgi:hypothetical protein